MDKTVGRKGPTRNTILWSGNSFTQHTEAIHPTVFSTRRNWMPGGLAAEPKAIL
jgi:hypothetical protein